MVTAGLAATVAVATSVGTVDGVAVAVTDNTNWLYHLPASDDTISVNGPSVELLF